MGAIKNKALLYFVLFTQVSYNLFTPVLYFYYQHSTPPKVFAVGDVVEELVEEDSTETEEPTDAEESEEVGGSSGEEVKEEENVGAEDSEDSTDPKDEIFVEEEILSEEEETEQALQSEEPAIQEDPDVESNNDDPELIEDTVEGDILDKGIATVAEDVVVEEVLDTYKANGMRCLADGNEIYDSSDDYWREVDENTFETVNIVELGVRYVFPLNEDMTVTFNCLPDSHEDITALRIEQIDINTLDLPDGYAPGYDYAYDITTDLEDGTFKYDVTLPKYEETEVEIIYTEKSVEEAKEGKLTDEDVDEVEGEEQNDKKVKAKDLDHFTIFIPTIDVDGANDYPGQKDLTKFSYGLVSGKTYEATFSWDEQGITNPVDACILINTDGDTGVNYAVCVQYDDDGTYETILYSCNDRTDKPKNCWDATDLGSGGSVFTSATSCTVAVTADDPFPAGDDYPNDRTATCNIEFESSFTDPTEITNVCSYPSGPPNSNASDCLAYAAGGFIQIEKVADPDDSTTFEFTISDGDGFTDTASVQGSGLSRLISVEAGTYSIAETLPGGSWSLDSAVCDDGSSSPITNGVGGISVTAGSTVNCVFNNSIQEAYLTLEKTVTNNNGGNASAGDFQAYIDGNSVDWGVPITVSVGSHTASESGVSGYTAGAWGGDCAGDGSITLADGQSATCTITNDDQPGTLIVKKIVNNNNGGTLNEDDFTFSVNGDTAISFEADGQNDLTVDAGTYTVTEPAVSGYATTYSNCTDVVITNGGTQTCTITNTDIAPTITLHKYVDNNDGGNAGINDFGLSVGGTPVNSGDTTSVTAGVPVALNETGLTGYEFVSITGDTKCPASLGGTITLNPGEDVTCTITNTDIGPKLTLIKDPTNDSGGTALPNDFNLTIGGTPALSGITYDLNANTPYAINESLVSGYTFVSITGDQKCPAALGGSITLDEGDDITCTITNDDVAPTLTLVKVLPNDDGGDAVEGDFQAYIDGIPVDWGTPVTLDAGSHTASEDTVTGYAPGDWGGDCADGGSITLAPGEDKTCTITNDDVAPKLTLIKDPTNDDGGNAHPDDFNLTIGGNPATSGVSYDLVANNPYLINETSVSGYSFVSITGDQKCPAALGGTITLDEGDDITCTITNDDQAPTITLVKEVVNNYGGEASASDFTLYLGITEVTSGSPNTVRANTSYAVGETALVDGYEFYEIYGDDQCPDTLSGTISLNPGEDVTCTIVNRDISPKLTVEKIVLGGNLLVADFNLFVDTTAVTSGDTNDFDVGDYVVSETPEYGYEASFSGDCDENGNVSLQLEDNKTCTITNTYIAGSISGTKYNDINGNGIVDSEVDLPLEGWTIFIDENANSTLDALEVQTITDSLGNYTFSDLLPGSYDICEVLPLNWMQISPDPSVASCHTVVLGDSQDITDKDFLNFELVSISGYKFGDTNGNGIWDDGEYGLDGWSINLSDSEGPIDTAITGAGEWPLGYFEFTGLGPGTYFVGETLLPDWTQTFGDDPYEVESLSGRNILDVDFGNAPLTDIHGIKWNDENGNGRRDCSLLRDIEGSSCEELLGNWRIFIDENDNDEFDEGEPSTLTESTEGEHFGWYWFYDLLPGEYKICEELQQGWVQTYPVQDTETQCHYITVPNNQEQTLNSVLGPEYNFGNQQAEPVLLISKENNTGGSEKEIGSRVLYTIIVEVTENPASGVTVTDLLPEGINYVGGSWTANSNVRGDISGLGEPSYASPGTWTLGDMQVGEIVTLTYEGEIGSVGAGIYKDLAWSSGNPWSVLAQAQTQGYIDPFFVGTEVKVAVSEEDPDLEVDIDEKIEEVGEVLGISLPATGSATVFLLSMALTFLGGLSMILWGYFVKRKKGTKLLVFALLLIAGMNSKAHAASLAVRLEEPSSPAFDSVEMSFVALDTEDNPITAQCLKKGPGESSFSQFGPYIALDSGGDTYTCTADSSVLTSDGTYVFRVDVVNSSNENASSNEVTVEFDSEGPEAPDWIRKEKDGKCQFELEFKTENDGQTSYVEIYRGGDREFEADAGARIATISIGPDEEGDYDDDLSSSECGKTFYYAVRAFDDADRGSDVTPEDDVIVTKTVTTTEEETEEAIPVVQAASVISDIQDEDAQEEATTEDEEDEGTVLGVGEDGIEGINFEEDEQAFDKKWLWLLIPVLLLLIKMRKKKRENKSNEEYYK